MEGEAKCVCWSCKERRGNEMRGRIDLHPDDTMRMIPEEIRSIRRQISLLDYTTRIVFYVRSATVLFHTLNA